MLTVRTGVPMNKMTILVTDDDPVIRKLFEKRLSAEGYNVFIAAGGEEAAEFLKHMTFDVVITDLVMPGAIDGIRLLHIAKEKNMQTDVIVITAHSSVDTAVEAMKKGAVDYLKKPVNFDELFLRLEKIAEIKALVKNAGDLREAMEVTESSASLIIQELELVNSHLQMKMEEARILLADATRDQDSRISEALRLLIP